jgi:5-methylcytosine-specific restriction endonuclease McrA
MSGLGEPYDTQLAALRVELYRRPEREEYRKKQLRAGIRSVRLAAARAKARHTDEQWEAVIDEFGNRCVRCGCEFSGTLAKPTKDHVVPIYQGGSDGVENLQPLCSDCNSQKGPETFNWADYRRRHGFDE